jgi:creatinine amidohydrolase
MAVLSDIANSIKAAGFERLVFLNGHGGNVGLLDSSARDIHLDTGLKCFCIQPSYWLQAPFALSAQEERWGIHAGELETSLMLHLAPELVAMDKAISHFPDYPEGDVHLFGSASSAWRSDDLSPEGVFGDATAASAAKGEALLQHAALRLAKIIEVISRFEVGRG